MKAQPSSKRGLAANGRLAILAGRSHNLSSVVWIDVFDFLTLTWTRTRSHPAVLASDGHVVSRRAQRSERKRRRQQQERSSERSHGRCSLCFLRFIDGLGCREQCGISDPFQLGARGTLFPLPYRKDPSFISSSKSGSSPSLKQSWATRCHTLFVASASSMHGAEQEKHGLIRVEGKERIRELYSSVCATKNVLSNDPLR